MMANHSAIKDPYFCESLWPLDVPQMHLIMFGISQAISLPFTIITNSLLIYALFKTNQAKTISSKFIMMMCISDICIGSIGQPLTITMVAIKEKFRDCALEKSVEYVMFFLANFSWFMLFWISVDRYFQVTKLNRYSEYMNQFRMRAAIIASMLMANAFAVIQLRSPSFITQVMFNIVNISMMTFVATLYVYMLQWLKNHDKNLKAIKRHSRNLVSSEAKSYAEQENKQELKAYHVELNRSRKELSAVKTIRTLIIAIFVLYGPYNVSSTYWTYYRYSKRANPALEVNVLVLSTYFIVLTNAAVNACIIINGNYKTRRFVIQLLRSICPVYNKVQSEQNSPSCQGR